MPHPLTENVLPCWAWAGWEPDRHYRRMGSSRTAYFGHGTWLEPWRRRLESRDTLLALRDAGVTTLITWCYKGLGLELERQAWPDLKRFVDRGHDLGLQVWGYTQAGSLYLESLQLEQPGASQWVARTFEGAPRTWGTCYYRFMPCLTHPDYASYLQRVAHEAVRDLGLDGLHFDNSYHRHCWCERCQNAFRQGLDGLPDIEKRLGLPRADHVLAPPLPAQGRFTDPLQQHWMEFGVRNRLAFYQRLRQTLHRAHPNLCMIGNPAFPRQAVWKSELALDPSREGQVFDVLFAENGNLPRVLQEVPITQVEAYAYAEAGGYRVLSSCWQPGLEGHRPPATPAQLWTGLAEEFSHSVAIPGNNWALRPSGDGERMLMDEAAQMTAFREAMHFFRRLTQEARLTHRRSWSELALYLAPDTLSLASETDAPALRALMQELLVRHIPFRVLFAGQTPPPETRLLVVWQQSCLSEEHLEAIATFARQPGRGALIAGDSGRFDETGLPRNQRDWQAWRSAPGVVYEPVASEALATRNDAAGHLGTSVTRATPACRQVLDRLLAAAPWQAALTLDAGPHVLIHVETAAPDRLLIHWRDQSASDQPIEGCRVRLRGALAATTRVQMDHPDGPTQTLSFQRDASDAVAGVGITVPPFRRYALLQITQAMP